MNSSSTLKVSIGKPISKAIYHWTIGALRLIVTIPNLVLSTVEAMPTAGFALDIFLGLSGAAGQAAD